MNHLLWMRSDLHFCLISMQRITLWLNYSAIISADSTLTPSTSHAANPWDCLHLASVTISHILALLPPSLAPSLHLQTHLVYGSSLGRVRFMRRFLCLKHASEDFMVTKAKKEKSINVNRVQPETKTIKRYKEAWWKVKNRFIQKSISCLIEQSLICFAFFPN